MKNNMVIKTFLMLLIFIVSSSFFTIAFASDWEIKVQNTTDNKYMSVRIYLEKDKVYGQPLYIPPKEIASINHKGKGDCPLLIELLYNNMTGLCQSGKLTMKGTPYSGGLQSTSRKCGTTQWTIFEDKTVPNCASFWRLELSK